jgi:LytS/YehU family sensor histidine kinase
MNNQKQLFDQERSKLQSELKWLKAQINPHFLFNTLNNLYTLAYIRSDKTAPLLSQLADLMRYMLIDAQEPRIALDKEIKYIEGYLELQQLKFEVPTDITFNIHGTVSGHSIEPLLWINIIENCFQHGNIGQNPSAYIAIELEITPKQLRLLVRNTYRPSDSTKSSGVGLSNLQNRLQLLYPQAHRLHIKADTEVYETILELNLPKSSSLKLTT